MLVSRPGYQAQLATALGHAFYGPLPYLKSDGTTTTILSGNSKLYSWVKYANTVSEILNAATSDSFTINSEGFQGCRLGSYAYFVDGSDNFPIRTNLTTNTAEYANGLNPPTGTPRGSLTQLAIDALSSATNVASDTFSGAVVGDQTVMSTTPNYYYQSGSNIIQATITQVNNNGGFGSGRYFGLSTTPNTNGSATCQADSTLLGVGANPAIEPAGAGTGPPSAYSATAPAWMQFDAPREGFLTFNKASGSGPFTPIQFQSPTLSAPNADRTCLQFYVGFNWYTSDTSSHNGFDIIVSGYSNTAGTGTPVAQQVITFIPSYSGNTLTAYHDMVFNLSCITGSIQAVTCQFCGASSNSTNGGNWVYCANPIFAPIPNAITPVVSVSGGLQLNHAEPTSAYWGAFNGSRITKDYTAGNLQNWSAYENILVDLSPAANAGLNIPQLIASGMTMLIGFRQNGSTTHYLTEANLSVFTADQTALAVNISTVPTTILSSFQYFEIVFTSDIAASSSTANFLILGGIVAAGNLAISGTANGATFAPYVGYYTEMTDIDNEGQPQLVNVIETDPSGGSNSIQPTNETAIAKWVLPAPINAETNWMPFYRGGGIEATAVGYPLKIATLPLFADYGRIWAYTDLVIDAVNNYQVTSAASPFSAADVGLLITITGGTGFNPLVGYIYAVTGVKATIYTEGGVQANVGTVGSTGGTGNLGDSQNSDNSNPYILWDHTTRTLTDNTPDSFLVNAEALQYGREQLPKGAQCDCAWQNRVWFAVDSTLYGSWNVVAGQESGVYTTTIDSSNDPQLSIKGFTVGVGAADNDTIIALVPLGGYLFILKNYSAWILTGTDPTNFTLTQYLQYGGAGAMAPRAVVASASEGPAYTPLGMSFNHVVFLGGDGLYSFDGSTAKPASIPLLPVLNVKDLQGNVLIPASVYSKIAITFFNKKLLIFAPEVYTYTDLVIDATTNTHVTSAKRPFTSADIGGTLNQTGGSGFNIANLTISNVVGGVAYLSAASGTVGSVGGEANFCAPKNTITWVFDTLMGGFTRYLISGTSAATLSASTDTNDIVICDYTGQIYLLTGPGDKSTPTGSLQPIPISATTAGFGQGNGQATGDQGFYAKSRPTRLWADVISPTGSTMYTFTVMGSNSSNNCVVQYTPDEGEDTFNVKLGPSAQGPSVIINVQASAIGQIRVRAIGCDFSKGSVQG